MKRLNQVFKKIPLKTFKIYVGKEVAIGFIEGALAHANIYDILHMIDNDEYNLLDNNPKAKALIIKGRRLLLENKEIIKKFITLEEVMGVLKEARPDIYSLIINHEKGRSWVENTIKNTLDYVFNVSEQGSKT